MRPCRSALTGLELGDIQIGSKEELLLYTVIPISTDGEMVKLFFRDPFEYMKYKVQEAALLLIEANPVLDFRTACEIIDLRTCYGRDWISFDLIKRWYARRNRLLMEWYEEERTPMPEKG